MRCIRAIRGQVLLGILTHPATRRRRGTVSYHDVTIGTFGNIGQDEQFYLLKMVYSGAHIRESEKQFLMQIRDEARELTPEFEALCEETLKANATN